MVLKRAGVKVIFVLESVGAEAGGWLGEASFYNDDERSDGRSDERSDERSESRKEMRRHVRIT
jgi:hypothetical protein